MYGRIIKPFFDRIVALFLFIILLPVIGIISLILLFSFKKNILFIQERSGKNGLSFNLIKFRTMHNLYDNRGLLLPDMERITPVGSFLRKTSLDELPQLINIVRGEMSFVGPRPLLPEYLPLYNEEQRRRMEVMPGVTGWAQVNGRNALSWHERFKLDVWYVDHQSFWLDLKILFLTLVKVLKAEGINNSQTHTMEPFKGNDT
jgi:undecaprenyl phosphate N,N'-diacetylbacillosamine 1-phosphate transferase